MIVRVWRGRTPATKADEYTGYLERTGVKDYRATPGNRGVQILRRIEDDEAEFLILSYWDSLDAIREFAGKRYERAVYYPEDGDYLLEMEPRVRHYRLALGDPPVPSDDGRDRTDDG